MSQHGSLVEGRVVAGGAFIVDDTSVVTFDVVNSDRNGRVGSITSLFRALISTVVSHSD
jgi:hypothetical protein